MTVYAIQEQLKLNPMTNVLERKFDLSPAQKFGEVKFVLSPNIVPFNTTVVLKELRENLKDFGPEDYLLLIGNPIFIGLATLVAGEVCDVINFLQWSGQRNEYIVIQSVLF